MLDARREIKYITLNDESIVAADGGVGPLSQRIISGDTANTRDGSQIQLKQIECRLQLVMNTSATTDFVRFVLFLDRQNNGATPAVTDVLVAADPNANYTHSVVVTKRYRILKDFTVPLSNVGSNRAIVRDFKVKCRDTVSYQGTTDTAASNSRNAVYFLIMGDLTSIQTSFNLDTGIQYTDS